MTDWKDDRPPAPSYLRILYLGKILQDEDTLTSTSSSSICIDRLADHNDYYNYRSRHRYRHLPKIKLRQRRRQRLCISLYGRTCLSRMLTCRRRKAENAG